LKNFIVKLRTIKFDELHHFKFKNCIEIINRISHFTEILKRENIESVIYIYRLIRDIRKINIT